MPLLATKAEKDNYINEITSKMSYVDTRKKGRVDISGLVAVINSFQSYGINLDISSSAHRISSILEEFSITDVYYNGHRIDVITTLDKNVVSIPKVHFEYDIKPDFYYVIKMNGDLTTFETIGFLKPEDVINSKSDSKYYYPKEFSNVDDFIKLIKKPNEKREIIGNHRNCETLFLRFLDSELSFSYKKSFIKHLMSCSECLEKFRYLDNFHNIAKTVTDYPEMTEKYYKRATGKITSDLEESSKIRNVISDTKESIKNICSKISDFTQRRKLPNISIPKNEEECINLIFNHTQEDKKFNINTAFKRKKAVVSILISLFIALFSIFGVISLIANNNEQELSQEEFVDGDFIDTSNSNEDFSSIWNSEMQEPAEITEVNDQVKKVSWEIPKKLSNNDLYVKFLQITGKNIQINLQNDLLVTRVVPTNRSVKVDVTFKNYGSIVSLKTIKSSGSGEIDNIIEKTVFNAFSYVRPPKTDFKNIDLTLSIEL